MTPSGSSLSLYDASSMKNGGSAIKNTFTKGLTVGKWHTLEFEIYVSDSISGFEVVTYIDGTKVATSTNYYNYTGEAGAAPNTSLDVINLRFTSATVVDVYIDNVTIVSE
jgi:hypothetical protein